MVPTVRKSVEHLVVESMSDRADELICLLSDAPDEKGLVRMVKEQGYLVFFHVALLNSQAELLYDSHIKRITGAEVIHSTATPIEVADALDRGFGKTESFCPLVGAKLSYIAKRFEFQENCYVLRLAFPYEYIHELKQKFTLGVIVFTSLLLGLFAIVTSIVIVHLMGPVRQMIKAIRPYHEGKTSNISEIHLETYLPDEFSDLATTFNSLSHQIQDQIQTLTRERNEKESILQAMQEGVIATDSEMRVVFANSMALFYVENEFHTFQPLIKKCLQIGICLNEEVQLGSVHLNVIASPMNEGVLLVLQDKSIDYKILEMRKEFIANASHELKTPITIVRGFAETLQDNPDLPRETVAMITQKIVRNCERMTTIVKNLLTLADIENLPQFRLQECALKELVDHSAKLVLSTHRDADIQIHGDASITVQADPELLEVALTNLLDNAAKYSKEKALIEVHIERQTHAVSIAVKDHGIGIPEQDLEHIFNRFYTVNKAESKKKGGSGLGLSICQTIMEKHYGRISVQSEMNKGTTFTMEFPL